MDRSPKPPEKSRTALVFIEFQNEWLDETGRLFGRLIEDKADFRNAVAKAVDVIAAARLSGWSIVHAGLDLRHDPSYRLFAGGAGLFGLRGAIPRAGGTWIGDGAEFAPPFDPHPGEFISRGRSGASALKNATLDAFLRNNRLDTLVLLGFATHICVESTLREAHDMGLNAYLVTDGCAAFNRRQHNYVLSDILHYFGAPIGAEHLIEHMRTTNA